MKTNRRGMDDLFAQTAAKLEAADAEIRAEHTGKPADEIESIASAKFSVLGLNLTGSLRSYAESVERNEPFEFKLG